MRPSRDTSVSPQLDEDDIGLFLHAIDDDLAAVSRHVEVSNVERRGQISFHESSRTSGVTAIGDAAWEGSAIVRARSRSAGIVASADDGGN